ncbi:MAG: hypothetical protein IT270_11595 [Saprospiraceae bacterium]|nr:hypothetical protein [Saprospiraceae bacterium]
MKKLLPGLNLIYACMMLTGILQTGGCTHEKSTREDATKSQQGTVVALPGMPADAQPATVSIRDLNFWVEGDNFYVVGVVDDRGSKWSRVWVKLQVSDKDGDVLKFEGNEAIMVPTFSDALPPGGRTSFFAGFPLKQFNGTPAKAQVAIAYSVPTEPGAILVVSQFSGVLIMTPKPGESTSTVERGWSLGGFVENPLPQFPCNNLRGELLVYGKDEKLYLSQIVISDGENPTLLMEKPGPLLPGEKRRVGASVMYDHAPRILDSIKIGRVELQPFDARPLKK